MSESRFSQLRKLFRPKSQGSDTVVTPARQAKIEGSLRTVQQVNEELDRESEGKTHPSNFHDYETAEQMIRAGFKARLSTGTKIYFDRDTQTNALTVRQISASYDSNTKQKIETTFTVFPVSDPSRPDQILYDVFDIGKQLDTPYDH